jgi:hypothetical protein
LPSYIERPDGSFVKLESATEQDVRRAVAKLRKLGASKIAHANALAANWRERNRDARGRTMTTTTPAVIDSAGELSAGSVELVQEHDELFVALGDQGDQRIAKRGPDGGWVSIDPGYTVRDAILVREEYK